MFWRKTVRVVQSDAFCLLARLADMKLDSDAGVSPPIARTFSTFEGN